eukprot:1151808-Pelagomonas_calceolata.AAC.3
MQSAFEHPPALYAPSYNVTVWIVVSTFFSGCQCPFIRNMVIELHNIASRMMLKVASEGSCVSNFVHVDVGSADRLAQHELHIPEQVSTRIIPPYLFDPSIPDQARCTSSRPDAILVTPCPTNPNRPRTSPSHRVLRSMRDCEEARSSTTPARQFHELNIQCRHICSIEIKYCEDTRPGAQLEASQQQHSELCLQLQDHCRDHSPHNPPGCGWEYTAHILDQFRKLGSDPQRCAIPARKFHTRSVQYAHKLIFTRRAIEKKKTHDGSGALGHVLPPPDPHYAFPLPSGDRDPRLFEPMKGSHSCTCLHGQLS